ITVPAISVSVTPTLVLLPINATQAFTATVNYDPADKGVTWTAVQGGASCGAPCGMFAPSATVNNGTTIYTAPSAVPATAAVAITATSVTDATKAANAAIVLTNGTVKLIPTRLEFGYVKRGFSRSSDVSLTNTGTGTLSISGVSTTPNSYSQQNDCGLSVAPGMSCTIKVQFK